MSRTAVLPPTAGGGGLRWARAVVLAVAAWCIASAAHVLGGGDLPPVAVVVALIAATAWALTLTLRTCLSGPRAVLLLGAGQVAMHVSLETSMAWTTTPPSSISSVTAIPAHHAPAMGALHASHGSDAVMSAPHAMGLLPSFSMLLAHAAAAFVLGRILAGGDRRLFSLLGILAELGRPGVRAYEHALLVLAAAGSGIDSAPDAAGVICPAGHGWQLPQHLLVRAVSRRGPPLFIATVTAEVTAS